MPSELSVNVVAVDGTSTAVVELPDDATGTERHLELRRHT